jgi:DNA-binding NarL/FixJ family response regulator
MNEHAHRSESLPMPRAPRPGAAVAVAVATRGGLIGEAVAALLREHGLHAEVHEATADAAPSALLAVLPPPQAFVLLDELGPLLEPTVNEIRAGLPAARMLLLTREADAAAVSGALELGVHGLVDGNARGSELVRAISELVRGRRVFPALVVLDDPAVSASLSRRQRDVLRLVAQGLSNQAIGEELSITVNTVKFHVRTIFRELGIHNRVEAARLWAAAGDHPFG